MNLAQLQAALTAMGVTPKEIYRSSLYLGYLQDTQTFFTTAMAGAAAANSPGLGNDYAFVKNALQSSNLLQELADMLDKAMVPAMGSELMRQYQKGVNLNYNDFFTQKILNNSDFTWKSNVMAFYGGDPDSPFLRPGIPMLKSLTEKIVSNFQQNILLACQRIITDRNLLAGFFGYQRYEQLQLRTLDQIKSSGSDFHNGGKQVLILKFTALYVDPMDDLLTRTELKMVYKPGDMEADCILVGNSAAVNNAIPAFGLTASLVETYNGIVNGRLAQNAQLKTLPTYRILPRNYNSALPAGAQMQISNAYGYVEYLNNDVSGELAGFCGWYPFAASDYMIYSRNAADRQAIIEPFYRMLGAWMALACTFSITDMHVENIRVNKYLPVLIDLEISLNDEVKQISDTAMTGENGGIPTVETKLDYEWDAPVDQRPFNPAGPPPFFTKKYDPQGKVHENRLFVKLPQKTVVRVNNYWLVRGFMDGMQTIQSAAANGFDTWTARTHNVLVRALPFSTIQVRGIRDQIYIAAAQDPDRYLTPLLPIVQKQVQIALTEQYNQANPKEGEENQDNLDATTANYYIYSLPGTVAQYMNYDVPIFYNRVDTMDLYDYQGNPIVIQPQVTILDANGNPQQVNTNLMRAALGRATYYANAPTINLLQKQLDVLAQNASATVRINALRDSLFGDLKIAVVPNVVDNFV